MNANSIVSRLTAIRDAYQEIEDVSASIDKECGPEKISDAIVRRSALLDKIARMQDSLEKENKQWRSRIGQGSLAAQIALQIKSLIYSITDRDIELQAIARGIIDDIRRQLFGLSSSSKAALAYVGQKDALRPRR